MKHSPHRLLVLVTAALAGLAPAHGQTPPADAAPAMWLDATDYPRFEANGKAKHTLGLEIVPLDSPAGRHEGFRFTVSERADNPLAVQAVAGNPRATAAKDTLFAHFYLRFPRSEAESGEGKLQFIVESAETYEKSVQFIATAGQDWKEFNVPFAARASYAPGQAHLVFRLGFLRQTAEVADFEIKDYGPSVPVASLPMSKQDLRYPGMEPDAPWRAGADASIRKIRRSPLTIQVVDGAGQPVADAAVEVRQTRHAFHFGSAVSAKILLDSAAGPDTRFSDDVLANFNTLTLENDLKWARWDQDHALPLKAAAWCQEHGLTLRGHNMVWPSWRHLPPGLKDLQTRPDELRQAVLRHVQEVGSALNAYAAVWDVINEPYDNHDLMDILGRGILTDVFAQAKQAAPAARLFINDYGIIAGNNEEHRKHYEQTIQSLVDQHAAVEGIGIQGHFGQEFTAPARIYEILGRYARFGLPMQITEFTTDVDDRQAAADQLRDAMTVCFSYPAMDGFILWGFYDGKSFSHRATLYDADGELTPAGKVYRELVFHRWWTHETVTTAKDGSANVDGFHGQYEVSARGPGGVAKQTVELKPGGSAVKIVLHP